MDEQQDGFQNAMAAFAAEDAVGKPNAVVEGDEPKAPEPEPAPAPEPAEEPPQEQEAAKTEPEKLEDEFIEFTGKQKERFNSVYGALKRLERENADLQRRVQQPAPVAPQPQAAPVAQPQPFAEQKPKLADFQDADQWGEAVGDWAARKAEHSAIARTEQRYSQEQTLRQQQEETNRIQNFLVARTHEGHQKFGQMAFDNVCADVANFAPYGSVMNQALFSLQRYPEVVVELGKNLHEADRISRLSPHDQIYEIKSLEKKIVAREELAKKAKVNQPTKVEAPGQGEAPRAAPSTAKLRQHAMSTGKLDDFAKIFMADKTL